MSSSESSPSPSPSPPNSQTAGYQDQPNLERLVTHLVSAKRALNSRSHVYRANELVNASRSLIEEIGVLNAKNTFGQKGLEDQRDTLEAIREVIIEDGDKVSDEFQSTLADLDKAHLRLDKTLNALRRTVVAARAKSTIESDAGSDEKEDDDNERTLYDFIDDATHESLLQSLRNLIDSYHAARGDLDASLQPYDRLVQSVTGMLSKKEHYPSSTPSQPSKSIIFDQAPSIMSDLFHTMESHATEMASLLSNLIEHHDKCVDALKHTDGGGEAARVAIQSEELTKLPQPGIGESLYRDTAPEPISEEQRTEMLAIVEADAPQVDDVVMEIKDYSTELENSYRQLTKEVARVRDRNHVLKDVLASMRSFQPAIPDQVEATSKFRATWVDIQREMQDKTEGVTSLSVFYEQFLSGYGKLLREVERRKASEAQMRKVADKARRELERLYDADRGARQTFMEDVSEYMPSDLGAWHGLGDEASRYEVTLATIPQDNEA